MVSRIEGTGDSLSERQQFGSQGEPSLRETVRGGQLAEVGRDKIFTHIQRSHHQDQWRVVERQRVCRETPRASERETV